MPSESPADPVYDEVAAFLGGLVAGGMRHVVLSPGSRSTPLTICAAAQPGLTHWMQLDERTAAFFALGIAKATRSPVALICTSGTAAANYFPAVIEASRTGVPLLVLSADRPPELHGGWGANQTIDQQNLFGGYPRLFCSMPVGGTSSPEAAADTAAEALRATAAPSLGPVHINWPFRKPLEPLGAVPICDDPAAGDRVPTVEAPNEVAMDRLGALASRRGVIVAGPQDDPVWTSAVASLADATGWPILAEATSQLRLMSPTSNCIAASERFLLASSLADALVPEVVLFAGATPTGTSALQWAANHDATVALLIDPFAAWSDTGSVAAEALVLQPEAVLSLARELARSVSAQPESWLAAWKRIDELCESEIASSVTESGAITGPAVVRSVADSLSAGSHLFIANSMSVRDLDRYTPCRSGVRVHSSRGASGIDGLVATASGIAAATGEPVTLLTGDIAFLHDIGSLYATARLDIDLRIVVVNDNGGGIFSMLPISKHSEDVGFHELFHTPHDTDLAAIGAIDGVSFRRAETADALGEILSEGTDGAGVHVVEILIDHADNMAVRAAIDTQLETLTP